MRENDGQSIQLVSAYDTGRLDADLDSADGIDPGSVSTRKTLPEAMPRTNESSA